MQEEMQHLQELIAKHSDDTLATKHGMVYQVWEDGEITLQKSGELLWQRTLHSIEPGDPSRAVPATMFPHQYGKEKEHGYIFTTDEGAKAVREQILRKK